MKLLIAEDELDLAEALTVFFERNHFSVDAVHNGADAYEYAATGAYDAVILDVMMPKLDGIQVLEKLRSEGVKTPIMMLTAKGQKEDRITGFNAGADDYLPKPFDPDELRIKGGCHSDRLREHGRNTGACNAVQRLIPPVVGRNSETLNKAKDRKSVV